MDNHAVDVPLTEHKRRVIAAALEVTATMQDALKWPTEAQTCRDLRLEILGDLVIEEKAA